MYALAARAKHALEENAARALLDKHADEDNAARDQVLLRAAQMAADADTQRAMQTADAREPNASSARTPVYASDSIYSGWRQF